MSFEHIEALKWYGKRTKIYSMFHEMLVDIEEFNYKGNDELVNYGRIFIEHYRKYDILNYENIWVGLNHIKSTMDNLCENNFVSEESILFVQRALGYTENWEAGEVFEGAPFDEEGINACLYAQKFSIQRLGEMIKNYSGMFESYCREWFMPGLLLGVHND